MNWTEITHQNKAQNMLFRAEYRIGKLVFKKQIKISCIFVKYSNEEILHIEIFIIINK